MPGDGHGAKLHCKREAAILALLQSGSVEQAAENVGIGPATLQRWLKQEAFQLQYREARRAIYERGMSQLQTVVGEAVTTLRLNLNSIRPAIQVKAATAILLHASRACELLDLSERLSRLESLQKEAKP